MKAFFNNPKIKEELILQLESHYKADEIIKGTYWKNGKGCAVGCTVHSANHKSYEKQLGIPTWLALLEDYIFENLPNEKAKEFPLQFARAIPVGFDKWYIIYHKFCIYLLTDIIKTEKDSKVIKAIDYIITLHIKASKGKIESNLTATGSEEWLEALAVTREAA